MRKLILIVFAIILVAGACRSKKQRFAPMSKTNIDSSKIILPEIKNVLKNSFEYDYLAFKSKCEYKDENNEKSFTMNFRMKYDSIVWISITAAGFLAARVKLDKDSIQIISPFERKYYVYDYDYFKKLAGVSLSLSQIQNLLTANLLFLPENYKLKVAASQFIANEGYIENLISVDSKSKIIEQILQHLVEQSTATVLYSDFKKAEEQQFPGKVDISISTANKAIGLQMENSGVNTAIIDAFPFEIPAKYEKGN